MRIRLLSVTALAALVLMAGACSSDDEATPSPGVPEYLKEGADTRPAWTQPDMLQYGPNVMTLQVELGDTLASFQSERDLMGAFSGDEIRGAAAPRSTGGIVYFPLSIGSFDGTGVVALKYYCDRLHRIYTITHWASFDSTIPPTGEDAIHRPRFTEGN